MPRDVIPNDPCGIGRVLEMIGGKWKGPIIHCLQERPRRFNELRRLIPGVSPRVLTVQLRQLEEDGLVERESDGTPSYVLSPLGVTLIPVLDAIAAWPVRHLPDSAG